MRVGVVEGFFGPEWPWTDRHQFCEALRSYGGDFYIYAPKRDPYLRKDWTEQHPADWWNELKKLSRKCEVSGVEFGVALSPFELHTHWTTEMKAVLREKVLRLHDLGITYLGLFFDDMKGAPDLAAKQAEIVEFTRGLSSTKIIFCPTYYSDDPILDKVFGVRPVGYLSEIGRDMHLDVEICWTGRKVISPTIEGEELVEVAKVLRRKPFIWDNLFANDGPKNCKFLKIKPFSGRTRTAFENSSGWALNLMNQPALSQIVFASAGAVLKHDDNPDAALLSALEIIAGPQSGRMLAAFAMAVNEIGLDQIDPLTVNELRSALNPESPFEAEVLAWLDGRYIVGPECLTD